MLISGGLCRPFVILCQQQGTEEPDHGAFVGEDANDIGAAFDFAVETLERVGGVDFRPVLAGKFQRRREVKVLAAKTDDTIDGLMRRDLDLVFAENRINRGAGDS